MRSFIKFFSGLVVFVVLSALAAPFFIDINSYRKQITTMASEQLGRDVAIKGPLKFRILPTPRLKLKDIEIASTNQSHEPLLANILALNVSVEILPLFVGKVNVKEIRLEKPEFYLESFGDKTNNWTFSFKSDEENKKSQADKHKDRKGSAFNLEVQQFIIEEGLIVYQSGDSVSRFEDMNIKASLDSLQGPFEIDGDLSYIGMPLAFDARLGKWENKIPLEMNLKAFGQNFNIAGDLDAQTTQFKGNVKLKGQGAELKHLFPNLPQGLKEDYKISMGLFYDGKQFVIEKFQAVFGLINAYGVAKYSPDSQGFSMNIAMEPGKVALKAQSAGDGIYKAQLEALNLQSLFTALKIDLANLPSDLVENLELSTQIKMANDGVHLTDLTYAQGDSKLKGNIIYGKASKDAGVKVSYDVQTPSLEKLARLVDPSFAYKVGAFAAKGTTTIQGDSYKTDNHLMINGDALKVKGDIGQKAGKFAYDLDVVAQGASLEGTLNKFDVKLAKPSLRSYNISATIKSDSGRIALPSFQAKISTGATQLGVKGHGEWIPSTHRSKLNATLNFSTLNLEKLMAAYVPTHLERMIAWQQSPIWHASHTPKEKKSKQKTIKNPPVAPKFSPRWSSEPMDLGFLKTIDGDITFTIPTLETNTMNFGNVQGKIHMANGVLEIPQLTAGAYGGSLNVNARLSSQKNQDLTVNIKIANANLTDIIPQNKGRFQVVKGKFNFSTSLSSQGRSQFEYVKNLAGPVVLDVTDGTITGFDLQKVTRQLNDSKSIAGMLSLLGNAFEGGQTNFQSLKGKLLVEDGVARIESMKLLADGATVDTIGKISLPAYTLNMESTINLTEVKNIPPFKATFTGSIDDPKTNLETGALQEYFLNNVIKGVGESLKNIKSGKPQDVLKGILGIGDQDSNTSGDTGQAPNSAPAPESQPNQDVSPEKAIKGLIKGLF